MNVAQVSKRISVISQDYSLWHIVSFKKKKVSTVFLQQVINRKCKFLGLQLAKVEDTLNLRCHSELKGLDISNCQANDGVLEELIRSCQYLEKIVAMNLTITSEVLRKICKQTLVAVCYLHTQLS